MHSLFDDEPPVIRVALPVPLTRCFDYILPPNLQNTYLPLGARVRVPYRNRTLVGVVMARQVSPDIPLEKLKPLTEVIDDASLLDDHQLALAKWLARYCHGPVGEVISMMLPAPLRQGAAAHIQEETYWMATQSGRALEPEKMHRAPKQAELLRALQKHQQPVAATMLRSLGFTSTQMAALEDKGLAERYLQSRHLEGRDHETPSVLAEIPLQLNDDQKHVVSEVTGQLGQSEVFLLEGVTGSGKTEVYLQVIEAVLKQGRQVLVLVPEIGLAPQTVNRFKKRFSVPVMTLHSGLNDKERLDAWLLARDGRAGVLIGTRSAAVTPFKDLGLIVVDEEHDASYKQGDGIRYSARDLAIVRGKMLSCPVVLGSATPSLETLHNATEKRFQWLKLTQRVGSSVQLPDIYLHDIQNKKLTNGIDGGLLQVMRTHLEQGGQVLAFINRRGFAPALMCHDCGWVSDCPFCDARMTLHREPPRLHCHHCDSVSAIPHQCPKCFNSELKPVGSGTERMEETLEQAFKDWPVFRVDRDTVSKKGMMEKLLARVNTEEPCVLVGTQMLAKGHHFPGVSLVVVLDADGGFYSSDFRGLERMGQLLTQVAGRAGRERRKGKVVVQTHRPDDPLLKLLAQHDYSEFSRCLLEERKDTLLPPYSFMAIIRAEANQSDLVSGFLTDVVQAAAPVTSQIEGLEVTGPVPSPMERRFGRYHMQIWLICDRRGPLHQGISCLLELINRHPLQRKVRWSLDVDPQELI
ncbi:primosomal protein N' [Oceanospirillum linum]|uniref:Replication restart protein PriA n=1 Tax=Oceanospirillum linum TaxID=966 RepID=A0A1T1H8C0_OCELI|nr:primosomal protein N' [Oceanospirillum linum]OOV86119.1 primosomal protein N' [Oceanospirillum linum]SEG42480.1 replication restart DNA helicase PriA [Oleiphilus messinensis]SMP33087.1 replication restart DNA helicase PriA [Oceanospirillum linum]